MFPATDALYGDETGVHFDQLNRVRVSAAPPPGSIPKPGMSTWEAEMFHKLNHDFPSSYDSGMSSGSESGGTDTDAADDERSQPDLDTNSKKRPRAPPVKILTSDELKLAKSRLETQKFKTQYNQEKQEKYKFKAVIRDMQKKQKRLEKAAVDARRLGQDEVYKCWFETYDMAWTREVLLAANLTHKQFRIVNQAGSQVMDESGKLQRRTIDCMTG